MFSITLYPARLYTPQRQMSNVAATMPPKIRNSICRTGSSDAAPSCPTISRGSGPAVFVLPLPMPMPLAALCRALSVGLLAGVSARSKVAPRRKRGHVRAARAATRTSPFLQAPAASATAKNFKIHLTGSPYYQQSFSRVCNTPRRRPARRHQSLIRVCRVPLSMSNPESPSPSDHDVPSSNNLTKPPPHRATSDTEAQ